MKCIIVDDEAIAIDLLVNYTAKVPFLRLLKTFTNPVEGLAYLESNEVDLVFLDIDMPDIDGIDFMKIAEQHTRITPHYILTTGQPQHALDAFEFNVTSYLLKPISFEKFLKGAQKVRQLKLQQKETHQNEAPTHFLFVKTEVKGKLQKIDFDDICYVEGEKNYISIYTDTDRVVTLLNLKDIEEQLPKNRFVRVNKSFIIAIEKVVSIEKEHIIIKKPAKHIQIPLGITYKETLFATLKNTILVKRTSAQNE